MYPDLEPWAKTLPNNCFTRIVAAHYSESPGLPPKLCVQTRDLIGMGVDFRYETGEYLAPTIEVPMDCASVLVPCMLHIDRYAAKEHELVVKSGLVGNHVACFIDLKAGQKIWDVRDQRARLECRVFFHRKTINAHHLPHHFTDIHVGNMCPFVLEYSYGIAQGILNTLWVKPAPLEILRTEPIEVPSEDIIDPDNGLDEFGGIPDDDF